MMNSNDIRSSIPTLADVGTLAVIAAGTGLALALAVGVILAVIGNPHSIKAGVVTWVMVQALAWLYLLTRWGRLVDAFTVPVYDDANYYDEPEPEPAQVVRVEVSEDDGRHVGIAELPFTHGQLRTLAAGLLSGSTFSEASWSGTGHPFTRSEFRTIRDVFLARGWARWNREGAPGQGVKLSPAGLAVIRHFASDTELISGVNHARQS